MQLSFLSVHFSVYESHNVCISSLLLPFNLTYPFSNIYVYTYPILFFDKYFKNISSCPSQFFATENCFYFGFILEFFIHFFMLSAFPLDSDCLVFISFCCIILSLLLISSLCSHLEIIFCFNIYGTLNCQNSFLHCLHHLR